MCGQGGAGGRTSYTQLIMLSKWESVMCHCCIKQQFYISIKIIFLINQSKCSQWIVLVQSSGKSGLLQAVKLWIVWTQHRVRGGFKINCHPCHLTPQLIGYYAKYRMFVPLLCNKSKSCFPHSLHRKGSNEIIHLSPEKLFYNYL